MKKKSFYVHNSIQLLTRAWTIITCSFFFVLSRGIGAGAWALLLSISTGGAAFSPVSEVAPAPVYYSKSHNKHLNWITKNS